MDNLLATCAAWIECDKYQALPWEQVLTGLDEEIDKIYRIADGQPDVCKAMAALRRCI